MADYRWMRVTFGLIFLCCCLSLVSPAELNLPVSSISSWARNFGKRMFAITREVTRFNEFSMMDVEAQGAKIDTIDGNKMVQERAKRIEDMLDWKVKAIESLVKKAEAAYTDYKAAKDKNSALTPTQSPSADSHAEAGNVTCSDICPGCPNPQSVVQYYNAKKLNDYDANGKLKDGYCELSLNPLPHFNFVKVNTMNSTVHVPTNVYDRSKPVLDGVAWSEKLDAIFRENFKKDNTLTWQYFGSATGFFRIYPGVSWRVNTPGWIDFYDSRTQDWYIQAATSPKDVVILVDSSGSMEGLRRKIAIETIKKILDTLSDDDFFNVLAFNSTVHYLDDCFNGTLIQANADNKKRIVDKLNIDGYIQPGDMANWERGLSKSFELLETANSSRRLCNSAIMIITDGAPEHYENVFKKYNQPVKHRVFTYLIGREVSDKRQVLWMACSNKGYYTHISTLADIEENIQNYVDVMARPLALAEIHQTAFTKAYHSALAHESKDGFSHTGVPGLRMMTSVAQPVFDPNSSVTAATKPGELKQGTLLGVMGTDVPIKEITKLTPLYELGVNAYPFAITNNGYILFHPDFRPTLNGKEKPNYNSVDLSEVEMQSDYSDEFGFPDYNMTLRREMVDSKTGELKIKVNIHYDNMTRVVQRMHSYYFIEIRKTPFSLGLAFPELYGKNLFTAKATKKDFEEKYFINNKDPKDQVLVNKNWEDYCFLEFNQTLEDPTVVLVEYFKNDTLYNNKCNKWGQAMILSMLWDARATEQASTKWKAGKKANDGVEMTFLGTRAGITRYYIFDDTVDYEWIKGQDKTIEELYYQRAVDNVYSSNKKDKGYDTITFMVPRSRQVGNDTQTSIVAVIPIIIKVKKDNKETPFGVVGFQMSFDTFKQIFVEETKTCKAGTACPLTCESDKMNCYLLDENGFILFSKKDTEIGKFFGEVDGALLSDLVDKKVYKRVTVYDYQGVCNIYDNIMSGASSFILNPLKRIFSSFTWAVQEVALFIIQFNLFSWWNNRGAWAEEGEMTGVGPAPEEYLSYGDAYGSYQAYNGYEDYAELNAMFWRRQMALQANITPAIIGNTTCVKRSNVFVMHDSFNKKTQGALLNCQICNKTWMAQRVTKTNMIFLVADGGICTDCESLTVSLTPEEVQISNQTILCQKLQMSVHRKTPKECHSSNPQEDYKNHCGSGHTILPSISLLVFLIILGLTASH
ncbi:voltage-dependent calcium channel subunit alpha-2/delta-3-like isoform X3 [Lineus longissimus]|uniref:voltage-dependent calcium channel subunit alpha-2/delta-3-like isoform X3 n=1 Tax=Lineus longissimus TaxID=88925 RepID=UPI00315D3824